MIGILVRLLRGRGDAPDRDDPPFLAGLLLGALVGAAIAGSSLWRLLRSTRRPSDEDGVPDETA